MITKQQAVAALHRQEFYHGTSRNRDGTPSRCRNNGMTKTWKTRPDEFRMPVKHGLKQCFYITQANADEWFMSEEEAIKAKV